MTGVPESDRRRTYVDTYVALPRHRGDFDLDTSGMGSSWEVLGKGALTCISVPLAET